jgi:hypothetical protein
MANLTAYSLFWVGRQTGGTNRRVLTSNSSFNHLFGYWGGYKKGLYIDNNPGYIPGGYANTAGFTGGASDTAWDLMSHTRTAGGSWTFGWNGTPTYSGSTSSANGTNLFINSGYTGETSDCEFGEIIIYNNVLTTEQVQAVEGYLARKWGLISSLPVTHPYYSYPPAIRLFKPSDLTSNVLWIDPSDASTLTFRSGTSNVNYMADKSSNAYTGIANGTVPLCNSVIGGLPALYYTSLYTNYIGISVTPITSSTLSIFAVSVQSNGGGQSAAGRLLSFGSNDQYDFNNNLYGFVGNNGNTNLSPYRFGWKTGLALTAGQPYVSSTIYDGTNVTITSYGVSFVGSNATSSAGGGSFYINTFIIGAEPAPDGNAAWYGYIGEIIVYNRTLVPSERQLVEGYLARKWGLSSYLTTNHVSYKFRPYTLYP